MKRRIYLARIRFHDWLWQGSANGKRMRRWLGPRLPMYLADPYYIKPTEVDRIFTEAEANGSLGVAAPSRTWGVSLSAGSSTTVTFRDCRFVPKGE